MNLIFSIIKHILTITALAIVIVIATLSLPLPLLITADYELFFIIKINENILKNNYLVVIQV